MGYEKLSLFTISLHRIVKKGIMEPMTSVKAYAVVPNDESVQWQMKNYAFKPST